MGLKAMTLKAMTIAGLIAGLIVLRPVAAQEGASEDTARIAKRSFTACRACHSLEKDGPQENGPALYGLAGRKAGSKQGFGYSEAMKQASIIWSEQTLDVFLKNPQAAIPGTKMGYAGMADDAQRRILIKYLLEQTGSP